jgi:hypothetical protein
VAVRIGKVVAENGAGASSPRAPDERLMPSESSVGGNRVDEVTFPTPELDSLTLL